MRPGTLDPLHQERQETSPRRSGVPLFLLAKSPR
jgi:hypothetical protein